MKKVLIASLLLLTSASSFAQHYHHGHYRHNHYGYYNSGNNWVAPLIIGGVVGAAIATRPIYQPETVIVQTQPVIVQQNQSCTPWTEVQNSDGTITRTRTCTQ